MRTRIEMIKRRLAEEAKGVPTMEKMCAKCDLPVNEIIGGERPDLCRGCRIWTEAHPNRPCPVVNWIVSLPSEEEGTEGGEFGVEIDGVPFLYYKGPDASPGGYKYRVIEKREFGETLRVRNLRGS